MRLSYTDRDSYRNVKQRIGFIGSHGVSELKDFSRSTENLQEKTLLVMLGPHAFAFLNQSY